MTYEPSRSLEIGDKRVNVYDDVFPVDTALNFSQVVMQLNFTPRKSFDKDLSCNIDKEKFRSADFLWPVTEKLFETVGRQNFGVTNTSVGLSHVYAAAISTKGSGTLHQDTSADEGVTFLYYANPVWRGEWAGETVFYDENQDAVFAVTPKLGRLVMFHSSLYHRAGVPHPNTPTFRYTVSVFYYPGMRE